MATIQKKPGRFQLDAKRLHVPFTIMEECPKCHRTVKHDLSAERYLAFPMLDERFSLGLYCDDCGHEFSIDVALRVTLEIIPQP